MKKCGTLLTAWAVAFACGFSGLHASRAGERAGEVKVVDPLTVFRSTDDFDKAPGLKTLRLVGPRNGYCSAQVVGTEARKATISELKGPGGVIPSDAVRIRYAVKDPNYLTPKVHDRPWMPEAWRYVPYPDTLSDEPPTRAELVPIWVTVRIPATQRPGVYTGVLKMAGREVPVRLEVCAWQCPNPIDWVTMMTLLMSPETLARKYGVEPWSEKHLALVEKQLRWAAGLGNKMIWIPVFYRTDLCQFPWVRFRKSGDGYEVDFSIVDKYLPLYAKVIGAPRILLVEAWTATHCGRGRGRPKTEAEIVVIDGSGKPVPTKVPVPGRPGSEKVFGALFDGMRRRVEKLGWDEKAIMIGWATDRRPSENVVAMFKRVAPYARWAIFTHGRGDKGSDKKRGAQKTEGGKLFVDGMEVGFYAYPAAPRPTRKDGIAGGWDITPPRYTSFRVYMYHTAGLDQYRSFPRGSICQSGNPDEPIHWAGYSTTNGITHTPLDFWPDEKGRHLLGRHNGNWFRGFHRQSTFWVVAPGPKGPIGTARYEMLREGFQETEARITIEKALVGNKIGGALAENCRSLLAERMKVLWLNGKFARSNNQWQRGGMHDYQVAEDWQDSAARLFDLAGEVAKATGVPEIRDGKRVVGRSSGVRSTRAELAIPASTAWRSRLIADVNKGARPNVGMLVGRRREVATVVRATPDGVALKVGGMEVSFPWARLPKEVARGLAERYAR